MGKFEEFVEARQMDQATFSPAEVQFYENEESALIPVHRQNDEGDALALRRYYLSRANASDQKLLTEYYFQNKVFLDTKAERYHKLGEGSGNIDAFASTYTNHSARKRKRSANSASKYFKKASDEIERFNNDPNPVDAYQKFEHEEKVMKLRLEARLAAAETKSISKTHEQYLKHKAKLSCYMMLGKRLNSLIEETAVYNRELSDKLAKKGNSLVKLIDKEVNELCSIDTDSWQWDSANQIQVAGYNPAAASPVHKPSLMDAATATSLHLIKRDEEAGRFGDYPCNVISYDPYHQPVQSEDAVKQDWNRRFTESDPADVEQQKAFQTDIIQRVEGYKLPTNTQINQDGMAKLFRNNAPMYYEMFIKAPAYLEAKVQENGPMKDYAAAHPEFVEKIHTLSSMGELLRAAFIDAHINLDSGKFFTTAEEQALISSGNMPDYQQCAAAALTALDTYTRSQLQADQQKAIMERQKAEEERRRLAEEQQRQAEEQKRLAAEREAMRKDRAALAQMQESAKVLFTDYNRSIIKELNFKHKAISDDPINPVAGYGVMLRSVRFDEHNEPIPEDKMIQERNYDWTEACLSKASGSSYGLKEMEKILAEGLPHLFDGIELPKDDEESVKAWFDKIVWEKPYEFHEMFRRTLGLKHLIDEIPFVDEYLSKNPEFKQKVYLILNNDALIRDYSRTKHNIRL